MPDPRKTLPNPTVRPRSHRVGTDPRRTRCPVLTHRPLMSEALVATVLRHTSASPGPGGRHATAIGALDLYRADAPSSLTPALYEPSLCVVVQGAKRIAVGETVIDFAPGECLVAALDLPVSGAITEASAEAPYLSVVLTLDPVLLADVARQVPGRELSGAGPARVGVFVQPLGREAVEALAQLVGLLDRPEDAAALYEPLVRELTYWLLAGPDGDAFARLAVLDGLTRRVARAVGAMKEAFPGPVRVDALAAAAGLSPSAFNTTFRTVTAMSPLQFYKRLRLLEARRRLDAGAETARSVAFAVGYQSPSQFSREYARTFGTPPGQSAGRV